ncbi:phospholipase D family protein [Luteibacter aegosomatissinici]|uniref:phospholipase D family protein n=1 Tax=Luteibacter aegosomatissinici TaxID=2911539 RepID=UPI001FFAA00E|nr:phospholipase D family protein [Luteibacter aegosomatissinici]UPG93895.1 phospholipase D-like domain-containing protein [Luteibacter aegosomatissinici]
MKLVGLEPYGELLRSLSAECVTDCDELIVAIPYAEKGNHELLLFDEAIRNKKPITFYGRIDGTCPIDPNVLNWFLLRQRAIASVECRLVPHWLHAKVIWWSGVGAYIGSANLTDRAWNRNFEAGVFLTQSELDAEGFTQRLDDFFDGLLARSIPLSDEVYKDQVDLKRRLLDARKQEDRVRDEFESRLRYLSDRSSPIAHIPSRSSFTTRKRSFIDEWHETIAYLRPLADRVARPENRPSWIPDSTPATVQCDQFLHAYYYNVVSPRSEKDAYLRHFERNRLRTEDALQETLSWWKESKEFTYESELEMMVAIAPAFETNFAENAILSLDRETFANTLAHAHAFGMHSTRKSVEELGFAAPPGSWPKILAHGRMIYDAKSVSGAFSGPEVFRYVIWGPGDVAERIWNAVHEPDYQLDGIGTSTFGEVVGWTRPNLYPPRNQRTNKAIRALGRKIKIAP